MGTPVECQDPLDSKRWVPCDQLKPPEADHTPPPPKRPNAEYTDHPKPKLPELDGPQSYSINTLWR